VAAQRSGPPGPISGRLRHRRLLARQLAHAALSFWSTREDYDPSGSGAIAAPRSGVGRRGQAISDPLEALASLSWQAPCSEGGGMRKKLVASSSAVALVAALGCAVSIAAAAGPPQSVVGSGWRGNVNDPTTPVHHFVVNAHSGPQGASGTFRLSSPNPLLDFSGQVTCLDVVGDQAIVGGVVTSGGEPGEIATGFAVGFIDNGPASDQQTFTDVEIATPVDCAAEQSLFTLTLFPVLNGNVVVDQAR